MTDSDRLVEIEARALVKSLRAQLASTQAALRASQQDTKRLDWLESWTKGDQGICPPGNHGGDAAKWLVFREDDSKGDSYGSWNEESQGSTIREAIDAAAPADSQEIKS